MTGIPIGSVIAPRMTITVHQAGSSHAVLREAEKRLCQASAPEPTSRLRKQQPNQSRQQQENADVIQHHKLRTKKCKRPQLYILMAVIHVVQPDQRRPLMMNLPYQVR